MQVYAVLTLQMQLKALSVFRDGATVHINYKAQFTDQPAARGRKKASAKDDLEAANEDLEVLDWDGEDDQRGSKQSKSSRGCRRASSSHEARGNGGERAQPRQGQWISQNNHNVSHMQKHPQPNQMHILMGKSSPVCIHDQCSQNTTESCLQQHVMHLAYLKADLFCC